MERALPRPAYPVVPTIGADGWNGSSVFRPGIVFHSGLRQVGRQQRHVELRVAVTKIADRAGENVRVHAATRLRPFTSSSPAKLASLPPMLRSNVSGMIMALQSAEKRKKSVSLGKLVIDARVAAMQIARLDRIGDIVVGQTRPLRQRPHVHQARADGSNRLRGMMSFGKRSRIAAPPAGLAACRQRIVDAIRRTTPRKSPPRISATGTVTNCVSPNTSR